MTFRTEFKVGLLVLIFFGPVLLAMVWYYGFPQTIPSSRTNRGELLNPVRPLPAVKLRSTQGGPVDEQIFIGQWTLLTVAERCGDACQQRLRKTRKVRALLHDDVGRVQRVLVSGEAGDQRFVQNGHPDLKVFLGGDRLRQFFGKAGADAVGPGVVYFIDPHGNWVLYYPADQRADAILDDVKHLLRLSHIG
ncbi:MAG: hypothetical protein L0H19_05300 [Salinisphaera sp.]|nr:hypothetical protein [Salinisphaera sp.]MDN5939408.1 hypothetical protein [Salinisphaera sp.]